MMEQYESAVIDCNTAIQLDPNWFDAYNIRGMAKLRQDQFESAIFDFDKVIQLNPNIAEAYYNRGNAKFVRWGISAANSDYQRALELAQSTGNDRLITAIKQFIQKINGYVTNEKKRNG